MKYQAIIHSQIVAILLIPVIFSIFFLAIRVFACYILPNKQTKHRNNMNKEIRDLIASTKGKFFSISFEKKDGTVKTVNAKDKYFRLLKGTGSPATDALREAGYQSNVNRNKETWFSFQPEKVLEFKCGNVHKIFR